MAEAATSELVQVNANTAGLLPGMGSLAPLKQVGILIAIAGSIAMGVMIALWSSEPPMRPLANLEPEASMDVINYLEQQQIPYQVATSGRILIPQANFKRIQMELGAQGVNLEDSSSRSYLDKDSGFGVSQRMEKARLLRSQENQLKQTLEQFNGVRAVKVHLAIPKESSFIKNRKQPSASILLNLYSRGSISEEQSNAMVDLIAGSIPNMQRNQVSITDQYGRLYHSGSMSNSQQSTSRELNIVRDRQEEIRNRIEQILTPIVGAAAYTVQVNLDMDFSKKEQTSQTFNPDLPAIRSERTIEDNRNSGTAGGVPGALSNQPPANSAIPTDSTAGAAGDNESLSSANRRVEAERNFDLDTTISHILPQVGVVERLSISIGLDYVDDIANAGQKIARTATELDRISRLIQAAVGFSVQRGDLVSVESFPFVAGETLPAPAPPEFYEGELFQTLLKPSIALILGLALIFVVLKPLFSKLSTVPAIAASSSGDVENEFGDLGGGLADDSGLASDQITLAGHENLELPPPTVGEVEKLEQAKGVVSNNPTLVAQLVKGWIEEDG
ncbi:MAG: flagellar M-ring protein FliF [Kangiellaceae bacterium]|nr:flagellar M-ring protein FliF [Kangiellaceae bacterium]